MHMESVIGFRGFLHDYVWRFIFLLRKHKQNSITDIILSLAFSQTVHMKKYSTVKF